MLRTFNEHEIRITESLCRHWEFITEEERKDKGRLPKKYNRSMLVPGAWEQMPGLESYRGKAWFRTSVATSDSGALRLVFGGVSHTGTVFVDGKKIGSHYDSFTPWDVVIPNLKKGEHEIVVEVDNTFGNHSALHIENDYFTYGGITRPAVAEIIPDVFIDRMFINPKQNGKAWDLDVRVRLKNCSKKALKRGAIFVIDDICLELGSATIKPNSTKILKGKITKINATPWEPETPCLYEASAFLMDGDAVVDDLIDRVGFREVKTRGKKLLLNGKPLYLRGFNRHEDHPQFGNALPLAAMATDLELMHDLGCNFVRTCHYPNDMRFLDLCDEMGFCVWEESHARTVDFKHPKFNEQIMSVTEEMIDWHYNRPCILTWGSLNECESETSFGRKVYTRVLKLIKKLDPDRPVTFADNRLTKNLCADLVDIVSWNIYDAWYGGGVEDVEPGLKKMLKWLNSPKSKGGKGKPVIISEFGAGGIYGTRHANRAKWTEEYQADVLDESLRVYLNHPGVCGASIWQFCDVRVTKGWWHARPRTLNNKGTVDEYRRPKLAYDTVKRRMLESAKKRGR